MIPQQTKQGLADTSLIAGWFGWFISHLDQVNGVLQFVLLLFSIVATVVAARYHWRKTKTLK